MMPMGKFSSDISTPRVDLFLDMGNPFLNRILDGFLKIGTVGAARVVAEETYNLARSGSISRDKVEYTLKKTCKEGAYWGTVAGLYEGAELGVERIRGKRDWKNTLIGGSVTGALLSLASSNDKDKVVVDAITGCAIATAAELLNHFK